MTVTQSWMNALALARTVALRARRLAPALLAACLWPAGANGQLSSSGFPVTSPTWEILVTDWGYSDLALDRRPGFVGREFLSGEWAAAIFYSGGQNPRGPVWFQKQWFYPDWVSNSDFEVEKPAALANPANPVNTNGFFVFQSAITNRDLRITMTYEMLDSVTGIAQGMAPRSMEGGGASLLSDRYVFRQTYRIENRSEGPLAGLRLFQFLHGLEMGVALYDDRDYGGWMGGYRYDLTQHGESAGFDTRSGQSVVHRDTLALHADREPGGWEAGYYGRNGVDNHVLGKPGVGVHLSVEANTLNGRDWFAPPEEHWVSGAQVFDLGDLPPGAAVTQALLLTVHTSYVLRSAAVSLVIRGVQLTPTNTLVIDFEKTGGGTASFQLKRSASLSGVSASAWEPLPTPCQMHCQRIGWHRFVVPVDTNAVQSFFQIQPVSQP